MKYCNVFFPKSMKLLLSFILLASLVLLEINRVDAVAFDNGTGTSADPYVISTAVQLNEIRNNSSKHFVLSADIDLNPSAYSAGWTPIGTFSGSFHGRGHTISDVTITGSADAGFFSNVSSQGVIADLTVVNINVSNPGYSTTAGVVARNDGTISNVKVIDSTIVGGAFTAAIAGANTGTITGSQVVRGSVTGGQTVGGLLGQNSGTFEKNRVIDTVVNGNTEVGGVVGSNQGAGVINWTSYVSSSDSLSTNSSGLGGLSGNNFGTITTSYVESQVGKTTSGSSVGGLTSYNSGTIENSYMKGAVRGTSAIGGLVGLQSNVGHLKRTYASGTLSTGTGGLVGQAEGEVSNSFWNTSTAGSTGYNSGTVTGSGTKGLSAVDIMKKSDFLGAGWDFHQYLGYCRGCGDTYAC
jgi:hypothetical protein